MPLIKTMRAWIGRRINDTETYYPTGQIENNWTVKQAGPLLWLLIFILALPVIALLVLIGVVYEAVIRVDARRRLGASTRWAISSAVGIVLAVGITWLALRAL
jgi:phosphotransferase system  glucose/maltose/N-acetylglucosamine-specific IIC component